MSFRLQKTTFPLLYSSPTCYHVKLGGCLVPRTVSRNYFSRIKFLFKQQFLNRFFISCFVYVLNILNRLVSICIFSEARLLLGIDLISLIYPICSHIACQTLLKTKSLMINSFLCILNPIFNKKFKKLLLYLRT